jgi:hypothetical protein
MNYLSLLKNNLIIIDRYLVNYLYVIIINDISDKHEIIFKSKFLKEEIFEKENIFYHTMNINGIKTTITLEHYPNNKHGFIRLYPMI